MSLDEFLADFPSVSREQAVGVMSKAEKNVSEPFEGLLDFMRNHKYGLNTDELTILDVGFNDPQFFFLFYHLYGLKQYTGVDKMSANKFKVSVNFENSIPEESCHDGSRTPFEWYELFFKYVISQYSDITTPKLDRDNFDSKFRLHFDESIEQYIGNQENEQFNPNLIIVSNVLHLMHDKPKAQHLVSNLTQSLSDDGFITIAVFNQNCSPTKGRYPYSVSELQNLGNVMEVIENKLTDEGDQNILIGRRKVGN